MQKKKSLCTEFCSCRAVEEASRIFWMMIELTKIFYRAIRAKQRRCVCERPQLTLYNLPQDYAQILSSELSSIPLYFFCKQVNSHLGTALECSISMGGVTHGKWANWLTDSCPL